MEYFRDFLSLKLENIFYLFFFGYALDLISWRDYHIILAFSCMLIFFWGEWVQRVAFYVALLVKISAPTATTTIYF